MWTIYQYTIIVVWLLIGASLVLFANRIVKWTWGWSVVVWKKVGQWAGKPEKEAYLSEKQPVAPVWILRISGVFFAAIAVLLFVNNFILPHLKR